MAFYTSTALTSASFPVLTSIGKEAFDYCGKLTILNLGATPPTVGAAFGGCPAIRALGYVAADGKALTGEALTAAQVAYKAFDDGDINDNLWYGWTIAAGATSAITIGGTDPTAGYETADGATLKKAFANVENDGTVKIGAAITTNEELFLQETKAVTLDLNGQLLTSTVVSANFLTLYDSSSLTIMDSGSGGILRKSQEYDVIVNAGTGNVTIVSGMVEAGTVCISNFKNGGVIMTGGTLKSSDDTAIYNHGVSGSEIDIAGGTVIASGSETKAILSGNTGAGTITIRGTAVVTSENTTNGSIYVMSVGTGADKVKVEVLGSAKVTNTATPDAGNAIFFDPSTNVTAETVGDYLTMEKRENVGKVVPTALADYTGTQAATPSSTPTAKTDTTVTLAAVTVTGETVEYAVSTTSIAPTTGWQDSTAFTGLTADIQYYFFARVKASTIHKAGAASAGTAIKTDKTDAQKLAAAKLLADAAVTNLTATNATTAAGILSTVNTAITSVTGVTTTWKSAPTITAATDSAAGSITGTIVLTCGTTTVEVTVNKTIAQLGSDAEKVANAKAAAVAALGSYTATNATADSDIMALVNKAITDAGITGITAAWKSGSGFDKTNATASATGSVTGTITLKLNSAEQDVVVNLTIAKLADKAALTAAITAANNAKTGISVNDNSTSSVTKGTKFVTTAEMKALTDAIAAAQAVADNPAAGTAAQVSAAVSALNNAVTTFNAAIKTGTYTSSSGGGGSSSSQTIYTSVPPKYTGGIKIIGNVRVPEYTVEGAWKKNANGTWNFSGKDGKAYANSWAPVFNPYADVAKGQSAFDWFKFDANGIMITGWHTDADGNTYYLNSNSDNTLGAMKTGWVLIDGKYYYFNEMPDGTRGKLFQNTRTPDGYLVDKNGVWDGIKK